MTLILLIFAALIVALQIALTFTLKRMLDLLAATREQVDALQRRVVALEQERQAQVPPPSALFTLAPRDDDAPPPVEPAAPPAPLAQAVASAPLPVLHEQIDVQQHTQTLGEQVRELARQGMPVRDIAERCGLSEAEAELMIRLRQEPL
ncbi:DUF2802 domain-containing protein [Thiomonas sp.]|uniref:DUF2802 domain-containing protein n=1 Tax=Thiomonas sp. TaxID=2047785 RepID=UPI002614CB03|nr:DUF2802 domain-containing protein [Thiomonas sp.]